MADAFFSRFIRGRQRWSHGVYTEVILKCSAFISASRLSCIANAPRPHSYKVYSARWRMHVFADFSAVVTDQAAAFTQKWSSSVQRSSLHPVFHAWPTQRGPIWIFKNMVGAMRYNAMQCGAERCDAVRCNAMRRGAVRWSISANLNSTRKNIHRSCGQEMATKTPHHGVTYSLKRDYTKVLQVRRCEFKRKTQGNMRPACVTIERIKLTNRDSNAHSTRS